jgi:outer membrane cobalamin receptor
VTVGGESAKRVAVLLDGLPLATGADGAVDLDPIPLAAIQEIKVQSGSHAATAGDAAMGGVVNLITRPALHPDDLSLDLNGGSFGTYRGSITTTQRIGGASAQAVYERFGRDDDFDYPDADTSATRTGAGASGVRAFLGVSPRTTGNWQVVAYTFGQEVGVPGALEQATPDATTDRRQTRVQTRWEQRRDLWRVGAALWHEASKERYRSPVRFTKDSDFRERFTGGRLHLDAAGTFAEATVEGELRRRRLEGIDHKIPDSSFGIHHRLEATVRTHARLSRMVAGMGGSIAVSLALDADDISSPETSPRIDIGVTPVRGVHLRGGWGESFRRPPLTALFWKADVFAIGNPNLRPEQASEWDAGLRIVRGPFVLDTRYFERDVTDIIVWERDFTGRYKPQNVPSSKSIGRDDHIGLTLLGDLLSFDYSHSYLDARDNSGETNHDGHVLILTPRHTHDVESALAHGRWMVRFTGRWVSLRYTRRQNDRGKTLDAYRDLGAMARVTVRVQDPELAVSMHAENITDERIELLERYPLPGRQFSAGITLTF